MMFHVGFFERSRSVSDRGTGESIKLCSLPDPLCFTLSLFLPSSELSFIWQFGNFLRKMKKLHQTRLTLGRWKWIYSWNRRLFPSQMFIIPLYISQDLCANGFSLVVNCNLSNALWPGRRPWFVVVQRARARPREWYLGSFVAQIAYITWLINQQMALVRHKTLGWGW